MGVPRRYSGREKNRLILFGQDHDPDRADSIARAVRRTPPSVEDQAHGIIGWKIEYDYGDDPADLARDLGAYHKGIAERERDAAAFEKQANDERRQAATVRDVLDQIETDPERKSLVVLNPKTGLPRRMNPYAEYSVDALMEQVLIHEQRAAEFSEQAAGYRQDIVDYRAEIVALEGILKRLKSA
jgi:hypothetical protein